MSHCGLMWMALWAAGFQLFSRYLTSPVMGFVGDDWSFLRLARAQSSWADIARLLLREPDRPVQATLLTATFRLFDDRPWCYSLLSVVAYSFFLILVVRLIWELTTSRRAALLGGVVLAVLPNLTESFHWAAMITVAYMQIAYVGGALAWVRYLKTGRLGYLAGSALLYGIGLGSYEFGFALPLAGGLLWAPREWKTRWTSLIPYGVVLALYLLWRFTHGFGHAPGILFVPRKPEISLYGMVWNAKEILSWWVGDHFFGSLREGFNGFSLLGTGFRRLLFLADIAAVLALSTALWRADHSESDAPLAKAFPTGRVIAFGLAWAVTGHALSLISWPAARLNLFPAVGVCLAIAGFFQGIEIRRWRTGFSLALFLCLLASQGTARSWRESGRFQRNLFQYLQAHQPDWEGQDLILFDTRDLRQRITPGLLTPPTESPFVWPHFQNAGLIRGFVPDAMVRLILGRDDSPRTLLDVEHGARIEKDELVWYDRFNPSSPHRTSLARVYRVDCLQAGAPSP